MVHIPSCLICSGKRPFCIHKSYPLKDPEFEKQIQEKLRKDFFGPSYSLFIGKMGYPDVFAGPMTAVAEKPNLDNPQKWVGLDYQSIIQLRSMLIRSKQKENIFSRSKFVQEMQELALSKRPTDVEILFSKKPHYSLTLSESFQPMGPSANLERMKITENVKIKQKVEKITRDEIKAAEASYLLHNQGLDVYKITTIFSSGVLGLEKNQKMVPTRYSITGIDDTIAKELMKRIRDFNSINKFMVFESSYMDNNFTILLMPGSWEFENFEVWAPGSNWSSQTQSRIMGEYEPYSGRSKYAESQAGGYYASRISVVKYLERIRKQAKAVVFREVSEGYSVPLGVWVVRETSSYAFKKQPKIFDSKETALSYIKPRLRIPLDQYIKISRILGQKKLSDF